MPDQYYTHDNVQSARHNPNVVPLSSLYTRVDGAGGTNHVREGAALVTTGSVFRAYEPPKRRMNDTGRTLCVEDGCKAWPMKELEYCAGHARSLGLIENWSTRPKEPETP